MESNLWGHGEAVMTMSADAAQDKLLTCGLGENAHLLSLPDYHEIQVFRGHTSPLGGACLSHDGALAVTGQQDGRLTIWNCDSGERLATASHPTVLESLLLLGDGRVLSYGRGRLCVWSRNLESMEVRETGLEGLGRLAAGGSGEALSVVLGVHQAIHFFDANLNEIGSEPVSLPRDISALTVAAGGECAYAGTEEGFVIAAPREGPPNLRELDNGCDIINIARLSGGGFVTVDDEGRVMEWSGPDLEPVAEAEFEVYSHAFCILERHDLVIASNGESGKEVSLTDLRSRDSR